LALFFQNALIFPFTFLLLPFPELALFFQIAFFLDRIPMAQVYTDLPREITVFTYLMG
jgi:hypothetical protein